MDIFEAGKLLGLTTFAINPVYRILRCPVYETEPLKRRPRRLRVADMVLKFITVRIDETLKRLEKRKKVRDKRAAKRATSAPPAGAAPAQPSLEKQMTETPAMPGLPKEA
jgi:small subunit ribosomal protein S6